SQYTANIAIPCTNGSNALPANPNAFAPKFVRNEETKKSGNKCAIKYAAIEFIPITSSGNAHLRQPFSSISHANAASVRKQIPPLNKTHLGVQIRFTTGQIPATCSNAPAASPATPANTNRRNGIFGAAARSHWPAINPRIIVPSVGIKLSVKYPPSFATKG